MRKSIKAISVLLVFVLMMSLTACGDAKKLQGYWKQSADNTSGYSELKASFGEILLNSDGTYKKTASTEYVGFGGSYSEAGTYTVNQDLLQLTFKSEDGKTVTYTYKLDGEILTLSLSGDSIKLKKENK